MKKDETKNGVSLFSQSEYLMGEDPLEEIFALFNGRRPAGRDFCAQSG